MVYSCSWPAYQIGLTTYDFNGRNFFYIICNQYGDDNDHVHDFKTTLEVEIYDHYKYKIDCAVPGKHPNYPAIAEHCNLWRNFDDISDSWEVITAEIPYYLKKSMKSGKFIKT